MAPEAAYKTVARALRAEIASGAYPPTRRLPTDAELSDQFGVSRQTVRQAFGELVAEGLVYRVRRRGSFAVARPSNGQYLRSLGSIEDLMALSEDTELEVLQPFTEIVDVAAAERLQLSADYISRGIFRRLHRGLPFGVTTFTLIPELGAAISRDPRLAERGARSSATIIQVVEDSCGRVAVGAHQSISATLIDAETAALIDAEAGEAGLVVARSYFDRQGDIFELAESTFNVRRYSYRIELRRSMR